MLLMKVAGVVAAIAGVVAVVRAFRCEFGWHPAEALLMRPGERQLRCGRPTKHLHAEWICSRCLRVAGRTSIELNPSLMVELQKQIGASRAQSKLIRFDIVARKEAS